jgi:hypothetical protein
MQSKFIINIEVKETVNDSYSDAYGIVNPNECDETYQETNSLEETDYSSVQQKFFLEPQPQIDEERKHKVPMDKNLGRKHDIYPINKPTFTGHMKFRNTVAKFSD